MWKIINWSKIEQRYAAAIKQNQKVKSVMVYCKPFDDEIIHSFQSLYQYINDKFPNVEVKVDKWVIDDLNKLKEEDHEKNQDVIK